MKVVRSLSKATLRGLSDVLYIGFSEAENVETRVQTHLSEFKKSDVVVHAHVSRLLLDGGATEQDLISHFRANKSQTWLGKGIKNIRKSKHVGRSGFAYVLVRVR